MARTKTDIMNEINAEYARLGWKCRMTQKKANSVLTAHLEETLRWARSQEA